MQRLLDEIEQGTNPIGKYAFHDWRLTDQVSPVKDQGSCGSCYAVSVISTIESRLLIKKNQTKELSASSIVDCSKDFKGFLNHGCKGGHIETAY